MDVLTREDMKTLIEAPSGTCVSIYLPTHRAGAEFQQDPIRLKNLLRQANEELTALGMRSREVEELLAPAEELLPERPFWQHQGDGLAVFRSRELFRTYRLPVPFEELAVVNDRFHLKPLIPLLAERRFYLLALSQKQVRLFHATDHSIRELPLPEGVPANMDEALALDEHERQLQFAPRAPRPGGGREGIFHGHGGWEDETRTNVLRYCRQIDAGLHPLLREEHAPLMLAGVEFLHPIYREANRYPHLLEAGVTGSPDGLRPEELHPQALAVIQPLWQENERGAIERYGAALGSGKAANHVDAVVPAAYQGRVDLLFVADGIQRWGSFSLDTQRVERHDDPHPGDEDLLNLAAVQTFLHGGTVYTLPQERMPDAAAIAAVLRY
jgi:hypothetical protein